MKKVVSDRIKMEKEKHYLQHYLVDNPAFQGNIKTITKATSNFVVSRECLVVEFKKTDTATMMKTLSFRSFKKGTLYKWMKPNKRYTLEELGLVEWNKEDARYLVLYADEYDADVWKDYCDAAGVSYDATEITVKFHGEDVTWQVDGNSSNDQKEESNLFFFILFTHAYTLLV